MHVSIVAIRPLSDTSAGVRRPQYEVTITRSGSKKGYVFECCRELTDDDPPKTLFHIISPTLESGFYEEFDFPSKTAKMASTLIAKADRGEPIDLPVGVDEEPWQFGGTE